MYIENTCALFHKTCLDSSPSIDKVAQRFEKVGDSWCIWSTKSCSEILSVFICKNV